MTAKEIKDATHIGGDLFAKYDGSKYVDIVDRNGSVLCFMSQETLAAAYALVEKNIFDYRSPLVLTAERKAELRHYVACGAPIHVSLLMEALNALEAAEIERERLRLELRLEQRRRQDDREKAKGGA